MIKLNSNNFTLNLIGSIPNLIITDEKQHFIISYMNDSAISFTHNYLYQYDVYPPKCNNITININPFQEPKINIADLFQRKTNIKYYIKFNNFIPVNGTMKLGEQKIGTVTDLIYIEPNVKELNITLSNNEI